MNSHHVAMTSFKAPQPSAEMHSKKTVSIDKTISAAHLNVPSTEDVVLNAMRRRLSQAGRSESEPFCVMDLGKVQSQYKRWQSSLRFVQPYFAVKCNPDSKLIALLDSLGSNFDCASQAEIELPSDIAFARDSMVLRMTFDNEAELRKIKRICPSAELILRCYASDPSATYTLSSKFGAHPEEAVKLLKLAKSLGLEVCGVSFHVGSGSKDPLAFERAIQDSRRIVDAGIHLGHNMYIVDIGGGFTSDTFDTAAVTIKASLSTHFSAMNIRFWAEPGRFFVADAVTVACGVIGRRESHENPTTLDGPVNDMLYLNDGMYGTFLTYFFEPCPQPKALRVSGAFYPQSTAAESSKYILWGPTCDGLDCILKDAELPKNLSCDDWIYFSDMGAYTTCLTTNFNGFTSQREIIYVSSKTSEATPRKCAEFEDVWRI
ncbi:Ornithine decarboxylase [Penicillium diatomitis]|uniref:ornithine decarboxylase n=1 Tax=Penicillium diatomitis TaxID=2819901 RepID=A0A9W9X6Q4_9EURO|nr:Ornithine decarboxylase [Penicillium diatomitis]KAJ5485348.1 Ornithine decarboxylase [Penicillium diatomitis]